MIPAIGAKWEVTAFDMLMFMFANAKERTAKDWHALLEDGAGLRICNIWTAADSVESLIGRELA